MMVRRFTREADEVDFDDEDAVLAEMERELETSRLVINEDRGLTGFGTGTVYRVESGSKEWAVVADDDQAHDLAVAIVKQDLDESPENFNQDFIESHIDIDRLRNDLESDVQNERYEYLNDMRPKDFWEEAERYGVEPKWIVEWSKPSGAAGKLPGVFSSEDDAIDAGEEWKQQMLDADEEGEEDEDDYDYEVEALDPDDSDISAVAEEMTKELLKDPMEYLEDIYGRDDAVKQAIHIAGIDIDAAADEAVSADGEGHFLSGYDGQTHETPSGLVYWRVN